MEETYINRPMKSKLEKCFHDEAMMIVVKIVEIAKNNLMEMGRDLPRCGDQTRLVKVEEVLILIAESFDLSADIVRPGAEYRRALGQAIKIEDDNKPAKKISASQKM